MNLQPSKNLEFLAAVPEDRMQDRVPWCFSRGASFIYTKENTTYQGSRHSMITRGRAIKVSDVFCRTPRGTGFDSP